VVGLFAVLSWDSTFPDRRDVLVLAPLPVRPRTMFLAKVAAVATALSLTIVLLHGASGLIWPLAFSIQATPQTVPALAFDPTPAPVSADAMQSVLTRDLQRQRASGALAAGTGAGLTIGVCKQGDARVFAYGSARPDSLFEVGSITKTFTALMLAQMVAQRKVALEDPIRTLLPPGLVPKSGGDEITLADLATHHSGLPNMVTGDWQEYLLRHGASRDAHPSFRYSNFGYGLLGQLLADRAGLTYSELLREQVTTPLGLSDTVVDVSPEQQSRFMHGYEAEHHPVPWDEEGLAGSGAIRSTAGDILKYLQANLHPEKLGGTLPESIAMAHQPRAPGMPRTRIALAWYYNAADGTWSHAGAMRGFTSYAFFHPKGDYAAAVLLNTGPDTVGLAGLMGEHIRQRLAGEPAVSLDAAFVPASSGFAGFLRWFAAYWFTMLASGVFIYCGVLGVQGLAAQVLPRRLFLRVSGLLQLAAFCLFVCGYFLQPVFGGLSSLTAPEIQRLLKWVPSYWFLGLFHELNGSMHPILAPLARRAWTGLVIVVCGTGVAYTLSYLRTLRRIVEEPDITPGSRRFGWLPSFGSPVQTAIGQFSVRTLVRSRQHRVILAFYWGIGFALTIFLLKAPAIQDGTTTAGADTSLLAASIVMMVLAVAGMRVVFALPLDLRANWIFRVTPVAPARECVAATRRALLLLSAAPVWTGSTVLCLRLWPWRQATVHLVVLGLLGVLLGDLALRGFWKLPFTCSYLPGKSQVHMVFLGAVGLMWGVLLGVKWER
jgi:CubicO group peptidase (beta-lactamase class C family)